MANLHDFHAGSASKAASDAEEEKITSTKQEAPKCIVVPIVLKMADVDHQVFIISLPIMSVMAKIVSETGFL